MNEQWSFTSTGAYRASDLFWYCLDHVPATEAWRCMPALISGELPPEVPPPPPPSVAPYPLATKPSNTWKWIAIGAIVCLFLKK